MFEYYSKNCCLFSCEVIIYSLIHASVKLTCWWRKDWRGLSRGEGAVQWGTTVRKEVRVSYLTVATEMVGRRGWSPDKVEPSDDNFYGGDKTHH
jgi:hypothetical protein